MASTNRAHMKRKHQKFCQHSSRIPLNFLAKNLPFSGGLKISKQITVSFHLKTALLALYPPPWLQWPTFDRVLPVEERESFPHSETCKKRSKYQLDIFCNFAENLVTFFLDQQSEQAVERVSELVSFTNDRANKAVFGSKANRLGGNVNYITNQQRRQRRFSESSMNGSTCAWDCAGGCAWFELHSARITNDEDQRPSMFYSLMSSAAFMNLGKSNNRFVRWPELIY